MSLITELRVPARTVLLHRTLAEIPEMCLHGERFIPNDDDRMAFFWARDHGLQTFRRMLPVDPTVKRVLWTERLDDGGLFQVEWDSPEPCILDGLGREEVALLQAVGQHDEWYVKARFRDRDALADFQEYCTTEGIEFELHRLYDLDAPKLGQYDLTTRQRDALVTALRMGYFDVPREATLAEVAEELDLSVNAVSERIRRGESNLFRSALTIEQPQYRR